mmetsp:Transcript_33960/g.80427  ORF Transcript_33960/g.80427 Transcript_33960/m.80427 type:complete len:123 (-) Transcript_33960:142-510(-)|eukprot:CAMPEP_0180174436 /NCGR_PEP_ID=MMETSP0986-20121125/36154_1 /TAXON_ID=697907 /ORGANISM="non described non described, Strain CCMP2293" /LENGTH=122 /DNA_ID=CAMNT_0022126783 /DNA_START=254 /DNA_END=622 /DNA_ORIENTATION=+
MPKKAGKAKAPAFVTGIEATAPFGFELGDILLTPLGVEVTILGVKPDSTGDMKLWAQFPGDMQCPLGPSSAGQFEQQGYQRVHESRHILRNRDVEEEKKKEQLENIDWKSTGVHLIPENPYM